MTTDFKWLDLTHDPEEFEFRLQQTSYRLNRYKYRICSVKNTSSHHHINSAQINHSIQFGRKHLFFAQSYVGKSDLMDNSYAIIDFPRDEFEFKAILEKHFKEEPDTMNEPKWIQYVHDFTGDEFVKKMLYAIKDTKYVVKTKSHKEALIFYVLNSEEAFPQLGYFTFARFGGGYNEILDMGDSKNILKILDDYFKRDEPFIIDAPTQSPLGGGNGPSSTKVKKFVANNPVEIKEGLTPVNLSQYVHPFPSGVSYKDENGNWKFVDTAWKLPVFIALSSARDRLSQDQIMKLLSISDAERVEMENQWARLLVSTCDKVAD